MIKFNYENAQFDYEPYPICYIPNFLDKDLFKRLQASYPEYEKFISMKGLGKKYSLSERGNEKFYYDFLKRNPEWKEFFDSIKSKKFINDTSDFLRKHNIDVRLRRFFYTKNVNRKSRGPFLRAINKRLMRSRFEFSIMPANGGNILPHTDTPNKMITLVVSFIGDGEWDNSWGGGTSVLKPKDVTKTFAIDGQLPHEETEVVKTFPFEPNQCVLFVKTYNSWHSVLPMTGPETGLRKTVTINIENIP